MEVTSPLVIPFFFHSGDTDYLSLLPCQSICEVNSFLCSTGTCTPHIDKLFPASTSRVLLLALQQHKPGSQTDKFYFDLLLCVCLSVGSGTSYRNCMFLQPACRPVSQPASQLARLLTLIGIYLFNDITVVAAAFTQQHTKVSLLGCLLHKIVHIEQTVCYQLSASTAITTACSVYICVC